MLSAHDQQFLKERYPELKACGEKIEGTINLRATFDKDSNQFQIIYPSDSNVVGGCELSGSFRVAMEPRASSALPRAPALTIDGYPHKKDRHIDHDGIACLCSPFIEREYLSPDLNVRRFMEELVVPFLYGQLFYDAHEFWPWIDYSHGVAGLMESYTPARSKDELRERLHFFTTYPLDWQRLRPLVVQRRPPSTSALCICGSVRRISHCHRHALNGILALRTDMKKFRT